MRPSAHPAHPLWLVACRVLTNISAVSFLFFCPIHLISLLVHPAQLDSSDHGYDIMEDKFPCRNLSAYLEKYRWYPGT